MRGSQAPTLKLIMSSIANDARTATISSSLEGWGSLPAEYAIPEKAPSLAEAEEYCRRLARSHYENFSVASWFLPERLRQDFFNVYAYCRISDDLGDEVGDANASLRLLDQWEAELDACYAGSPRHPVFVALAETVRKCEIPKQTFVDLLTAFRQDQRSRAIRHSRTFSAIAVTRRIRLGISSSTSADTGMRSVRRFPISPALRCNWRISGRM